MYKGIINGWFSPLPTLHTLLLLFFFPSSGPACLPAIQTGRFYCALRQILPLLSPCGDTGNARRKGYGRPLGAGSGNNPAPDRGAEPSERKPVPGEPAPSLAGDPG